MKRRTQQLIGRRARAATFLSPCPLNFSLCGGDFAARQHHSQAVSVIKIPGFILHRFQFHKKFAEIYKNLSAIELYTKVSAV